MFVVCVRTMFQYKVDLDYIVLWQGHKRQSPAFLTVKFVGVLGSGGALA